MEDIADLNQSTLIKDDHIKPSQPEDAKAANASTNVSGNTSRSQSADDKKLEKDGSQENLKSSG